jgi:hypothetical protein
MTSHLQRRKNAKTMRAEADAIDQRRLAATIKKLCALKRKATRDMIAQDIGWARKDGHEVTGPIRWRIDPGIWDDDIALLTRALDPPTKKRGPPLQLGGFHKWIAAHFLWLRKSGETPEDALFAVGEAWGVSSRTTVEKAVRAHEPAALELLAALGADPMPNIYTMANIYTILSRP